MFLWTLFVAVSWATVTVEQVPNPRSQGGWVSDMADIIPPDVEQRMNAQIDGLKAQTGAEIAMVTVSDVEEVPKDFATALFNRWGIGDKQANNGLLVLLVLDQRRIEMETGYGLEAVLSDGWLGTMQAEVMVPRFKAQDYAGGLELGLERVVERLRGDAETVRSGSPGTAGSGRAESGGVATLLGGTGLLVVLAVPLLILALVLLGIWIHRRRRHCQKCDLPMVKLSEAIEDDHLSEGQQTEESVGSIEWSVYQCTECEEVRNLSNRAWLKPFGKCRKCGFRTAKKDEDVLEVATEYTGGQVRVTLTCAHCGKVYTHVYDTAATGSSSSYGGSSSGGDSSGGGSFGGGSSGGGGAGSSW